MCEKVAARVRSCLGDRRCPFPVASRGFPDEPTSPSRRRVWRWSSPAGANGGSAVTRGHVLWAVTSTLWGMTCRWKGFPRVV
ncbi:hypothetical protein FKM82_025763 [Ascaphus truei]